ncbi:hypothetical protein ACPV5O_25440 [Vibrio maritimus]|uniref:hypothetical protein n=1 Tax=Vibrio maritimus TaxID=990268 RepID=UPI004067CF24
MSNWVINSDLTHLHSVLTQTGCQTGSFNSVLTQAERQTVDRNQSANILCLQIGTASFKPKPVEEGA